jgi:hypothetical protein
VRIDRRASGLVMDPQSCTRSEESSPLKIQIEVGYESSSRNRRDQRRAVELESESEIA